MGDAVKDKSFLFAKHRLSQIPLLSGYHRLSHPDFNCFYRKSLLKRLVYLFSALYSLHPDHREQTTAAGLTKWLRLVLQPIPPITAILLHFQKLALFCSQDPPSLAPSYPTFIQPAFKLMPKYVDEITATLIHHSPKTPLGTFLVGNKLLGCFMFISKYPVTYAK